MSITQGFVLHGS